MFEQEFQEITAHIWFDDRDRAYADEEGIGRFENGWNLFCAFDALTTVAAYDRALLGKHYKAKYNRLLAQRNAIVSAFGPEMAERVGFAIKTQEHINQP